MGALANRAHLVALTLLDYHQDICLTTTCLDDNGLPLHFRECNSFVKGT